MQMDAGLDTGAMLLREALPIAPADTASTLHDKLAAQGARLIVEALPQLDKLVPAIQKDGGITYASKITKEEAQLDWHEPATTLARRVRAFNPFPGATALLGDTPLKLWRAEALSGRGEPGTVLASGPEGVQVACGEGVLCLTELHKPGGKRLPIREFLAGFPLPAGSRFRAG